jgi:hypothetical protein
VTLKLYENTATRPRCTGSAILENRAARRREEASWRARGVPASRRRDRRDAPVTGTPEWGALRTRLCSRLADRRRAQRATCHPRSRRR